ncbi:MAG TPA: ankyrin repeat domain-containing protein [Bryobacteraceae bacterium]|nr:ankyrin repeat domain-containing protein [Bryobacteraceae bacterium]
MRICVLGLILSAGLLAQPPVNIDFRRDVQPIFQANCVGCHGPSLQMNGFRLDRRGAAMKGGTIPVIGPGNSAGSRLYLKLLNDQYGPQMPPTGPLKAEEIAIIKAWIDQGAAWPDDLAGETPPPPSDRRAARLMDAIRAGDRQQFRKLLNSDAAAVKLQGPGGATPLMYAALYGDLASVRLALDKGADGNAHNQAGATALMWAVDDLEKTRLLIERGADVNASSDNQRTPLMIAAGRAGNTAVVKLLLDKGAKVSATAPGLFGETNALEEAALAGDEAIMRLLIERGADPKSAGPFGLFYAIRANCTACFDLLIKNAGPEIVNPAMFITSPPLGDAHAVKLLLDHGADARAKSPDGISILIPAAASDLLPADSIKALIAGGADVNASIGKGPTVLDVAKRHGQTPVVELLLKAGARAGDPPPAAAVQPKPAASPRDAVARSLPLLQRSDATFLRKSGCVGCHNNTLTAMTVAAARRNGFPVDEEESRQQVKTISAYLEAWRDRALQGIGIPGDSDTVGPVLLALAAAQYPPDPATDAMARFLKGQQRPDGRWDAFAHRPPVEASTFASTAAALRAIQVYAPKPQRAEYEQAVKLAAAWLLKTEPRFTDDRVYRILGLSWSGASQEAARQAGGELAATQRPDGGWSQIPTLASDAYATGEALVALRESGMPVDDLSYQRGVTFLLRSQHEDGSWHVNSRVMPIQPYFESDFPHGRDQFISCAATNWAVMALLPAGGKTAAKAAP